MSKSRRVSRWVLIVAMIGGGTVFQTTGCNDVAAGLTAGWATSIANSLISSWTNQWLHVPTFNLNGLTT